MSQAKISFNLQSYLRNELIFFYNKFQSNLLTRLIGYSVKEAKQDVNLSLQALTKQVAAGIIPFTWICQDLPQQSL